MKVLVATIGLLWAAGAAQAATQVNPFSLHGWRLAKDRTGRVKFRSGPDSVPCGKGSIELRVKNGGDDAQVQYTKIKKGTLLSDLTELSYWTFTSSNSDNPTIA